MDDIAIHVDSLSKRYRIQQGARARYGTLRDALVEAVRAPFRRRSSPGFAGNDSCIWALKDVSFEVKRGEVVGIIGRNGAGKTTLLKILARITEPTEGYAEVRGRVGSLLEVGTGFHPELTGRENIYLNGAILGMKKAEIDRKFDEIVAFAEIEKFIDTPVKFYSSGMYVRLAFAVAAHLDPEILLVDEVLAVGDAQFQKKCLGKMGEVAGEGRTVLFVSHNMGAISSLTERTIYLEEGKLKLLASTESVIAAYIASSFQTGGIWQADYVTDQPMQITQVTLSSTQDSSISHRNQFDVFDDIVISVDYVVRQPIRGAVVAANIHASDGTHLISLEDIDANPDALYERQPGNYRTSVTIPGGWLNCGTYLVRVGCGIPRVARFDNIEVLTFVLVETGNSTVRGHRRGHLLPMLPWRQQAVLPITPHQLG